MSVDFSDPESWPGHVLVSRCRRALGLIERALVEGSPSQRWKIDAAKLIDEVRSEARSGGKAPPRGRGKDPRGG